MGQDGRFEKWASGILGAVSLVLALHLAWPYLSRYRTQPHARIPAHRSVASRTKLSEPSALHNNDDPTRASRAKVSPARKKQKPARAVIRQEARPVEKPAAVLPKPSAPSAPFETAQSLSAPPPAIRKFQTLGYVEKQDGTRQAVISKGDQVFVVHQGEVFNEHYRVLSISRSTVEAADLTVPQTLPVAEAETTLAANSRSSQAPKTKEEVSLASGATLSQPALTASAKTLGYVEKPGGRRAEIVADGDEVRIVPSPIENSATLLAGISASTTDETIPASVPAEQSSVDGSDLSSAAPTDFARADLPEGMFESLREPVAFGAAREIPKLGLPEEATTNSSPGRLSGLIRNVAARNPSRAPGSVPSNPAKSSRRFLKAFCYVERPSTGREAFVALGNRVYTVREGSTIANRYRVLRILPEGVEVEEARIRPRPPPLPKQEIAQTRKPPSEAAKSGNHSPPVQLPWDESVRPVAFLLTDFASNELPHTAEPRLFARVPAEPTPSGPDSSIPSVDLGSALRPSDDNSNFEFAFLHGRRSRRQVSGDLESLILAGPGGTKTEVRTIDTKPQGITPLPLRISAELLRLPGQGGERSFVGGSKEGKPVTVASAGTNPSLPEMSGPGEIAQGDGSSSAILPTAEAFNLPLISRISGRDLLLRFSIGDNSCYFP